MQSYDESQAMQRKLLREMEMNNGCYSHKTAVGAGALTAILRVLLEIHSDCEIDAFPNDNRNFINETATSLNRTYLIMTFLIILLFLFICCRKRFYVIYGTVWRRLGINRLR